MDKETIDRIYNIKNYIEESFKSDHWKLYYKNKFNNFDISKTKKLTKNHEYPNFMPIRLMRIYQSIKKFLKIRTSEIWIKVVYV